MKKLGLFAMAFALVLGLSQCKKENNATSNDESAKVPITLNVGGDNGSRVAIDTETGVVTFENGDVLHVASNGVYVGTMTYNGNVFSGEINEPTEGQKLQFYFLGNKTPEFNSDNTECSVVIDDQTEYLPVISYAPSRENYQVGKTDYNATLLNKCALVKFNVTTASNAATGIWGLNNKVTVTFATNEFTYGQDGEGVVTLAGGNGEKWAILLPHDEMTETEAQASDGSYTGTCGTIPAIAENDYLTYGIDITITLPVGAINGLFTINANGDQVYFSKGNLQYQANTDIWRFAENQWNYVGGTQWTNHIGNVEGSSNNNISPTYSGWIDLFGWGTSGYNHGAVCYQPWSTNTTSNKYYAYGSSTYNLYDQTGQADWGYNPISNGGDAEGQWRTLNQSEWNYIFNMRSTMSGIRYAEGNVNGVNGTILLPDNWDASLYELNNGSFTINTITASDWINILEANGAVFLPCAGARNGTRLLNMNELGEYYSSSYKNSSSVYGLYIAQSYLHTDYGIGRSMGCSVRLVRDVE